MPIPISKSLKVTHRSLISKGAFDGFIDVDSRLYVDPHLLASCPIPELSGSSNRFEKHFQDVLRILRQSKQRSDIFWREARKRLVFKEIPLVPLGYSKGHTAGNAIGGKLASDLTDLAKEIINVGISDPGIFELIGLLQEKIGADRISDMTIRIILPDLLEYSQRVAKELKVETREIDFKEKKISLPYDKERKRLNILIPLSLLRHLPVANSWYDIDTVVSHNSSLRARVNPIIGETWKQATSRKISKAVLRRTLLNNPELIKDLLNQYKDKPADPYDFDADPAVQQIWFYLSNEIAIKNPIDLSVLKPITGKNLIEVIRRICDKFRHLIEDNRLSRLLYNDDSSPRKERVAQLTFYAIADTYCEANDLELSPEADAGAGPVDFKISSGYKKKVTVEVKLSSNPNLVHGFKKQLPAYAKAEKSIHSIYLIIRTTISNKKIKDVLKLAEIAYDSGQNVPEIIIIDGIIKPSASKL